MSNELTTGNERETILAGKRFASRLNPGDVVLLKGDLGAGKTHFVKGIASFFGIDPEEIQSPTFALVHEYPGRITLYHLDCYRLKNREEAFEFGLEDYLYSDGICIIEWPEIVESLLPDNCLVVEMRHCSEKKRRILISHPGRETAD